MKTEKYEFTIPEWAVCPLEYGADNYDGLTDSEINDLESFIDSLSKLDPDQTYYTITYGEESYFTHDNDIDGIAGSVIDAVITVFLPGEEVWIEEYNKMLSTGIQPCFEVGYEEDWSGVVYFEPTNTGFNVGTVCNVGLLKDFDFEYDKDFSFNENLEALVDQAEDYYREHRND